MSQCKEPIIGMVAPTIDIFSLVLMESSYPLISKVQPPMGCWWTQIKIGLTMEAVGLPKVLFHLIFWDKEEHFKTISNFLDD